MLRWCARALPEITGVLSQADRPQKRTAAVLLHVAREIAGLLPPVHSPDEERSAALGEQHTSAPGANRGARRCSRSGRNNCCGEERQRRGVRSLFVDLTQARFHSLIQLDRRFRLVKLTVDVAHPWAQGPSESCWRRSRTPAALVAPFGQRPNLRPSWWRNACAAPAEEVRQVGQHRVRRRLGSSTTSQTRNLVMSKQMMA